LKKLKDKKVGMCRVDHYNGINCYIILYEILVDQLKEYRYKEFYIQFRIEKMLSAFKEKNNKNLKCL
jgi:hypothetical protein